LGGIFGKIQNYSELKIILIRKTEIIVCNGVRVFLSYFSSATFSAGLPSFVGVALGVTSEGWLLIG
jgi:hypothetical protein